MKHIGLLLLIFVVLGLVYSCKHETDPTPPQPLAVTWGQAPTFSIRSRTSVVLSATITEAPTGQAATIGFVWSKTNALPTVADNKTSQSVTLTSLPYAMRDSLTGLETSATYIARAYLTTASGTVYSPTVTVQMTVSVTDLFAQTLTGLLQNRDIGYGFVLFENDELKASGNDGLRARATEMGGPKNYITDTKMHIASMSKTIAAMAFTQLAALKGIRTTDKISPYLPPSWPKGENIDQITFRDLFTHRSGIIGLGNNCQNGAYSENIYSGLKQLIANGVKAQNRGQYCYQNANVGLMRVLIPALAGYAFTGNDGTDDGQTQQLYLTYVQKNIFEKAGLTNIVPTYPTNDPTYCYSSPYIAGEKGWNPGSFFNTLGAYGWYMTPREAGKLYATVLSSASQDVLPTAYKDTLLLNSLGCFRVSSSLGDFQYHDGWWYLNNAAPYTGLRTIWMKLPNNLTVVLFTNSLNRQVGLFPSVDGTDIVPFVFRAYTTARQLSGGRLAPVTFTLDHAEPH